MSEENHLLPSGNAFDRIIASQLSPMDSSAAKIDTTLDDDSDFDHFCENQSLSRIDFCLAIKTAVNGLELFNVFTDNLTTGKLSYVLCYL